MFDKLIDVLLEFIAFFKFWRMIPVNKKGVRIRWGKNPVVMEPGFHLVYPFEIDHVETVVVVPEWTASMVVHITTSDNKTISVGPILKYTITDPIAWLYGVNEASSNLHEVMRFCTADILTEYSWAECTTKPVWTKIKNRIKDKTKDLGVEIEDFGLIDLAISRIYITSLNQ